MTTGMKNKLREDFNAESSKTQINSQATRKLVQMMDGFLRDIQGMVFYNASQEFV